MRALGLLKFGFEELKIHRIYTYVDPENVDSQRVLEKIGMTNEGHLIQNMIIHGEHRDSLIYAIIKPEWKHTRVKRERSIIFQQTEEPRRLPFLGLGSTHRMF